MNDRALELFEQAGEEAYKLCREHGRKVGEVDYIWVSIMAATLYELVVKECAAYFRDVEGSAHGLEEHFGFKE